MVFLNFSCKDEMQDLENKQCQENNTQNSLISISDHGFLKFESQNSFEDYINSLKSPLRSSNNRSINIEGFHSLKDLKESINNKCLRSGKELADSASYEEYKLMVCQDILDDSILMNVMDTTLRIQIGDNYYKITEKGTFCAPLSKKSTIDSIISRYDKSISRFTNIGNGILKYEDILFSPIESSLDSLNDQVETLRSSIGIENSIESKKMLDYDLYVKKISMSNYWICGFSHSETRKFDSSHRMEFKFYNKNFFFWKKAGFSLSLQKRRKVAFWYYWHTLQNVSDNERVIGFFNFDYTYSLNPPLPPLTSYNPYPANVSSVSTQISGKAVNVILSNVQSLNMFGDLGNMVQTYVVDQGYMTKSEANAIYNASYKETINYIRSLGTSFLSSYIKKTQKDPMRLLQAQDWDGKHVRQVVFGEKNIGAGGAYDVTLNFSWGISISFGGDSWSAKPYIPTDLSFNDKNPIDFYGAIKYQNTWKGVRFIKK